MTPAEKMSEGINLFFIGFAETLSRGVKVFADFVCLINEQSFWEKQAMKLNDEEVKKLCRIYNQTKKVRIKKKLRKRIGKILEEAE